MRTGVALLGAELDQLVLDADPVEPVGQEAHGLLVAEVGLAHPALGLLAAHAPALGRLGDLELAAAVDAGGPDHDAGGLRDRALGAGLADDLAHGVDQGGHADAGGGADREDAQATGLEVLADHVGDLVAVGDVDLVERHQARAVLEAAVPAQLVLDHVEVVERVAARLDGGGVDDVHEGRAALDVAQEVVAEAATVGGTLDQAGHVGDGERHVTGADDAEVGHQGGERVVGDLGPRARHGRDQRRLAGAREADQADVGDDLELEAHVDLVAGLAEEREAGSLALGAGQRGVAEAAATALGDDHLGAGTDHVAEDLAVEGLDQRAVGHGEVHVAAVGTVAVDCPRRGHRARPCACCRGGSRSAW